MTVNSTTNRVAYNGNGTANPLAVNFPFQMPADLKVVASNDNGDSPKILNTDYTITGSPDSQGFYPNGGSVVPSAPVPSGTRWTIIRDPVITQLVQHVDNDPIPAASIDNPVDKLTMICQRLKDRADRAVTLPDGDATVSMALPGKAARAGRFLTFDLVTGAANASALTEQELAQRLATLLNPAPAVTGAYVSLATSVAQGLTLAQADVVAAVAGYELLIDRDYTLLENVSFTAKGIRFLGAKIALGDFDLTFSFNALQAPPVQLFVTTGTGRVKGTINALEIVVNWWGTTSASVADSATYLAGNYCLAYIAQSNNAYATMACPSDAYFLSDSWTKAASLYCPQIVGRNTNLYYTFSGKAPIQIVGSSGARSGGRISGFQFNGAATSWGIEIDDQCFLKIDNCLFGTNAKGIVLHSKVSGGFVEYVTWENCDFDYGCLQWWHYKITAGTGSFHGSGPLAKVTVHNQVANTLPGIIVDAAAIVYNAPLNYHCWSNSTFNHISLGLNSYFLTYGAVTSEIFAGTPTFAAGTPSHAVHVGTVQGWNGNLKLGVAQLADEVFTNGDGVLRCAYKQRRVSAVLPEDGGPITVYPSGGSDTILFEIELIATNYVFKYTGVASANGITSNKPVTILATSDNFNVAAYGAPAITWDGKTLTIANANYPAATVTAYITATHLGQAIYGGYN